jgi:hypothetical protein
LASQVARSTWTAAVRPSSSMIFLVRSRAPPRRSGRLRPKANRRGQHSCGPHLRDQPRAKPIPLLCRDISGHADQSGAVDLRWQRFPWDDRDDRCGRNGYGGSLLTLFAFVARIPLLSFIALFKPLLIDRRWLKSWSISPAHQAPDLNPFVPHHFFKSLSRTLKRSIGNSSTSPRCFAACS